MRHIRVKVTREELAFAVEVLLVSAVFAVGSVSSVAAMQTVFINADGSVYPASVPIQLNGDTYVFTGDVCACLLVNRSDVVIDGAGHALRGLLNANGTPADVWIGQGPSQEISNATVAYTIGIDVAHGGVTGLTIKNLNIRDFSIGMYVWTTNNTITGNAVAGNIVGVLLSGSNNEIIGNYVADNTRGIFFGTNEPGSIPLNLTVSRNSFCNNTEHFSGCVCKEYNMTEVPHTWDNGTVGNFWDNYNGADADGDGIGDSPYVIDVLNKDRHPLMQSYAVSPTVAPPAGAANVPVEAVVTVAVLAVIVIATVASVRKRRRR